MTKTEAARVFALAECAVPKKLTAEALRRLKACVDAAPNPYHRNRRRAALLALAPPKEG